MIEEDFDLSYEFFQQICNTTMINIQLWQSSGESVIYKPEIGETDETVYLIMTSDQTLQLMVEYVSKDMRFDN